MSKQEREICEFEILNKFCLHFNLINDNFCLKARSENGYGFREV